MNEMKYAKDSDFPIGNLLPAPAVLVTLLVLFFGADFLANGNIENDGYMNILILPIAAAFAAALGRIATTISLSNSFTSKHRAAIISLGFFVASIVVINAGLTSTIIGFTFALVGISTFALILNNRNEESSILLSIVIGFHLAVAYSARHVFDDSNWSGSAAEMIDAARAASGSMFFAFWAAAIVLGLFLTLAMRGRIEEAGSGSWFSDIPQVFGIESLSFVGAIFVTNLIPVIWLGQIDDLQVFTNHHYLGSVWALFTSVVIVFLAFCHAERWHVLGTLAGVNWTMYTFGHLQEIGNSFPELLSGNSFTSTIAWFFLAFWLNVGGVMIASRGYFGDIAPMRQKSDIRRWWQAHSYGILVGSAVLIGLAVRTGWNVLPAMNASGTGLWDMTGGSDPWYMKRVVDYIIAERSHYIFDADRAYPMGAINPRPPLFSWSLALGGIGLSWLTGIAAEEVAWWSVAAMPAIFGALIVLPIAGLASRVHSKQAGIFAAWLIALMPGHISHSTFGLADHDAFALLFLALAFYFWVKAVEQIKNERMFSNPSSNPLYLFAGIREMWSRSPAVMANATLSGISFATVALGWKGFVYGPGILFLAFAGQIFLNMIRRRDSLPLTSAALQMMLTTFLIPFPFYIWPGLNLLFDPSGFQPMFYIIGFTLALGWVTCSFRDKPWLLVLGSGIFLMGGILGLLYVLQYAEIYNGWDILFTGGFYFSKNKIFGTIGEAQAPSRGVLFASYGPIVFLISIGVACIMIWKGARKERQGDMLLGLWVFIAAYMAFSAGRFIFNATPAMAVVGGIGISSMWQRANFVNFAKEWRRSGIGTPRTRFRSIWPATKRNPGIPAMLMVILMISSQHMTYGIDSGIPRGEDSATDVDQTIHDIAPDIFRLEALGLSILNSNNYDPDSGKLWYMGTFGPGFNSGSWNMAYDWLAEQDSDVSFSERPAFVSWWDYGFQALAQGQHPTVADNFQSGIPNSGAMLLAAGQDDTLSLFITTLAQGDRRYNGGQGFTDEFNDILLSHMSDAQIEEFNSIISLAVGDSAIVESRALAIMASDDNVELLFGGILADDGTLELEDQWKVRVDGEQYGNLSTDQSEAMSLYNEARSSVGEFDLEVEYYEIGGYLYTPDLIIDFDDVSTGLHRTNARLSLSRAFLLEAFDNDQLTDMYHDMTTSIEYDVQDYEGSLGELITRNNDIRYFAVDNRLYPLGGKYYEDYSYHRGQTTGIFHAPTTLSGLDTDTYISSLYLTQRGDGPIIPRTVEEFNLEYQNDIIRNQYNGQNDASDIIRMVDIDYQHQPEFFETMVARIYVGYGTSTLGLAGDAEQPMPHFYTSGAPGSYLENAYPLPGAMMNDLVLSNWYDAERCEVDENGTMLDSTCTNPTIGSANTQVKIMKYYSGATLEGTVELDGHGVVPNARILIERDAFSGDEIAVDGEVVDRDDRTYWIPIGTTDADENGRYSFQAPAGKIRVTAFFGESDLVSARTQIMTSDIQSTFGDIFEASTTGVRSINPVTGILGNVSGSTWLSETIVNISGEDGHSNGDAHIDAPIIVNPAHATGRLVWTGSEFFDGDSVTNVTIELTPAWDEIELEPYVLSTSVGTVEGENLRFEGLGEVTFTGDGSVVSQSIMTATDFTGNFTQVIYHNHSLTGDGEFSGRGLLDGTVNDDIEITDCDENDTMPEDFGLCMTSSGEYLLEGTVNATGRFTANGSSSFTQKYTHATLIGSGVFSTNTTMDLESYGTLNGSGIFTGEGIFGGEMVEPGTFHIVDAIPGNYDVTIVFDDDRRIEINDGFTIPQMAVNYITKIDINGGALFGLLINPEGEAVNGTVILRDVDTVAADIVDNCEDTGQAPCLITPDEDGKFEFGPIIPGEYIAEIDIDGDGFSELSENYFFDANETSEFEFPMPVPMTSDVNFGLFQIVDGVDEEIADLNVSFHLKDGSGNPVEAIYDSDAGSYYVELTEGIWILNHTLSNEDQLWEQIEIGSDDFSADYYFHTSQLVTGTVYYNEDANLDTPLNESKTLDHVQVDFNWDGFSTSVQTDGEGHFSVVLPQGSTVDATVQLGENLKLVDGIHFTVEEGMDAISIDARPGYGVAGAININRIGNSYNANLGGWESVVVIATNSDYDVTWRAGTDENGLFQMVLPKGEWEFTLEDSEWLSPDTNITNVDGINNTVEILVYPANTNVEIDFFLDNSEDNNASNGTAVTYDFTIISMMNAGIDYPIQSNGTEWTSVGHAQVPIEPGIYRIEVDISDANEGDLFGTRIMSGDVLIDIGLDGTVVERAIGFDPEWRVSIAFTNESGGILAEQLVRFTNTESNWILSRITDDNGIINDFIGEGDWVVSTDVESVGISEGLRELISVSVDNAELDLEMSTSELAQVSFTLYEDNSANPIGDVRLNLESTDGLGSFSIENTNSEGMVTIDLVPGNWDVSLDYMDYGKQWLVESMPISVDVGGDNDYNITAQLFVELSGTIFWDLNDNNEANAVEGIVNVTLMIFDSEGVLEANLTTDNNGDWSYYVPAETAWQLNTSYEGFEDVSRAVSVGSSSNSIDIELTAGQVLTSGIISYIDETQFSSISDSIVLELIPTEGLIRDNITPEKILEDGEWNGNWSAMVEPGNWILRASVADQNLVAMGLIDASVVDGGTLDVSLSNGGILSIETHWLDYDGNSFTLADVVDSELVLDLGLGLEWIGETDEDGGMSILLPNGRVDLRSEFEVHQMDRNMSYIGGQGIDIHAGQETPKITLTHARTADHSIDVTTLNLTSGDDSYIGSAGDVTVVVDDENGFVPVEFVLAVDYLGHESFDSYSVGALVTGSDSTDWVVEFHNGSGDWNISTTFDIGLDNSVSFTDLHVRVTPAEQNVSHSFIEGHTISIQFSTQDGFFQAHDVLVKVPQLHGFELSEPMDDVYGISIGESKQIGIKFTNSGNGDERYEFEFDDSELPVSWERTGATSHTIGGFVSSTHTIIVTAPANATGEEDFTIYVSVTDKVNGTYDTIEINVRTSEPVLKILDFATSSGDAGQVETGTKVNYLVTVENSGLVDASLVQVNATLCEDIHCAEPTDVSAIAIKDVPAGTSVSFSLVIDLSDVVIGPYYINFDINSSGFNSVEEFPAKNVDVRSPSVDGTTDWIGWLLGAMLLIAAFLLTKTRSRRPNAPF